MLSISSIPDGLLRKIKTGIHGLQALLVSIAWILTLAVLTKSGVTGSATKFYFFLVCCQHQLSILRSLKLTLRYRRGSPYQLSYT
jgi:hypothetical protein